MPEKKEHTHTHMKKERERERKREREREREHSVRLVPFRTVQKGYPQKETHPNASTVILCL